MIIRVDSKMMALEIILKFPKIIAKAFLSNWEWCLSAGDSVRDVKPIGCSKPSCDIMAPML